jgi:hypothetical protein
MNIFNLTEEYLKLMRDIEDAEGELTPELAEALEINQKNVESKLKAYRYMILMLKGHLTVIEDEVNRLRNLAKSKESTIDRLRDTMLQAVLLFGEDGKSGNKKLDFIDFKLWTTNRQSAKVENPDEFNNPDYVLYKIGDKLDTRYLNQILEICPDITKIEKVIDNTTLTNDLKLGVDVEGVSLITKPSLTIK